MELGCIVCSLLAYDIFSVSPTNGIGSRVLAFGIRRFEYWNRIRSLFWLDGRAAPPYPWGFLAYDLHS